MQVNIVKAKTGCDMTIEELAKSRKHIGFETRNRSRRMLAKISSHFSFVATDEGGGNYYDSDTSLLKYLQTVAPDGTFHIFDTAKELYEWMAE